MFKIELGFIITHFPFYCISIRASDMRLVVVGTIRFISVQRYKACVENIMQLQTINLILVFGFMRKAFINISRN